MAARYQVEMMITSARELKNVNARDGGALRPYAEVWVEAETKCRTYAAVSGGGACPYWKWNQKLYIPFSTPISESTLHITIFHDEAPHDNTTNRCAGSVQIDLGVLSGEIGLGQLPAKRTYQLTLDSTRPQGELDISITIHKLGVLPNQNDPDDPMDWQRWSLHPSESASLKLVNDEAKDW